MRARTTGRLPDNTGRNSRQLSGDHIDLGGARALRCKKGLVHAERTHGVPPRRSGEAVDSASRVRAGSDVIERACGSAVKPWVQEAKRALSSGRELIVQDNAREDGARARRAIDASRLVVYDSNCTPCVDTSGYARPEVLKRPLFVLPSVWRYVFTVCCW